MDKPDLGNRREKLKKILDIKPEDLLFQPLSADILEAYPVDHGKLESGGDEWIKFDEYKPSEAPPQTLLESMRREVLPKTRKLKRYFEGQLFHVPRKNVDGYLCDISNWEDIRGDHPFFVKYGYDSLRRSSIKNTPGWETNEVFEYLTETKPECDEREADPHIILITCHDALGIDGELLVGEVMVLAQAIYNRINQEDAFPNTSLFPVLMASFFGPQHGRLLQANFDVSGKLDKASIDLFLRFLLSEPQSGPELEFFDWDMQTQDRGHEEF